ncbi:MAG: hypothetical protein ACO3RV_08965 [Luteolibacter sp.]
MRTEPSSQRWEQAARAARESTPPQDLTPPDEFMVKIQAIHGQLWCIAKRLLWRRWSILLAAIAAIVYLIVYTTLTQPSEEPVIPRPSAPGVPSP